MPEVTRVVRREYRTSGDHDYESDDDRSTVSRSRHGSSGNGSYRTVQRYRVTPSRVEEIDRDDSRDDDRRSIVSPRSSRLEIDRFEGPPRPKSSIEVRERPRSTVVERYVERREREPEPEKEREFIRERIIERREPERETERERTRTVVYEDRREDRREEERPWDRRNKPWEDERNFRETDVRIEKRTTERREEPYEVERYQRETEYYDRPDPAPAPIIIRQRAPEPQQIIVQEAPAPLPIIVPRARTPERVVKEEKIEVSVEREREPERRREPRREEDEYYYRRDVREVHDGGPTRRDKEWALGGAAIAAPLAVAAYRHRERRGDREVQPRDSISDDDYSDDESGYVVRRRVVTKDRSRSHSPHHKRHLAEGALAGAGVAAILANHRDKVGNGPEHRGRNVAGGAALGALGAEVLTRARSRYREREEDRDRSRSRSRSRSTSRHSHRKVKTGLALAAAGLAAVAATQYVKNRKANKEEAGRGRSRSRRRGSGDYSDDYSDYDNRSRSRSKHMDPAHRRNTIAKAGAATAAVAAVANHFRSKSRGRSRSKSRIRTGAEIAGAGLAGAAVAGLYENRKAKEERAVEEDDDVRRRSRSRSRAKSNVYKESRVDPELGMVQYGTDPVDTRHTAVYDPAAAGAAYGAARSISRSRSRSHGRSRRHRKHSEDRNSRSRSRVRDIAGAAAGTAAAAIGINQYKKRKEKKEAERERVRREYEASPPPENYYAREYNSDQYSPSPPHASGGSYFPQSNSFPPPPTGAAFNPAYDAAHDPNFHYEPNTHLPPDNGPIPPYNPQDYVGQPSQANPVMTGGAGPAPVQGHPGEHVSTNGSGFYGLRNNPTGINLHQVPVQQEQQYFPPPPTAPAAPAAPFVKPKSASEVVRERELEEAGLTPSPYLQYPPSRPTDPIANPPQNRYYMPPTPGPAPRGRSISPSYSSISPNDTPTESEADAPPKSVNFAPLSPQSSRRLSKIHAGHGKHDERDPFNDLGKQGYDSASGEPKSHHRRKHRRVRKRNRSDPSSNRPSGHRSSSHHRSRGGEEEDDSIEELPDRFDRDGRRIDGDRDRGAGGSGEMVERLAHDFGDVIDGRKSWKDLLGSFGELGGGGRH